LSLAQLPFQSPDPLLALIGEIGRDPRREKIDLSVGVYRDEAGRTPVMKAVKQAERLLIEQQGSKSYLGPEGDEEFVARLAPILFGSRAPAHARGLQTPGGTGALRLAADLLALRTDSRRIWLALPAWPNHLPVLAAAGLDVRTFEPFDPFSQTLRIDAMWDVLEEARPGDAVLLQGCCHNPTGVDPSAEAWAALASFLAERRLLPLIDVAYQGFGDGLEQDALALRQIVAAVPEAIIAYSCNKNFGLYRDRVGAMFVVAETAAGADRAMSNARTIARTSYSMPPDHGAAAVRLILSDPALSALWEEELDAMRARLQAVRRAVARHGSAGPLRLDPIGRQKGMFSLLPLPPDSIERLKRDHAIYVAPNGRINLAGMPLAEVGRLVEALAGVRETATA